MEYWRTDDNQIRADFAYRIGKIARQYDQLELSDPQSKFEGTLYVCLLQSLLTHCMELLEDMSDHERQISFFSATFPERAPWLGLNGSMVRFNTFEHTPLTYHDVLKRIRHALSHPTTIDIESLPPSTGYTTLGKPGEQIQKFCLVCSPDVGTRHRKRRLYGRRKEAEGKVQEICNETNESGIEIREEPHGCGTRYRLWQGNHPIDRVFRIDVPVENVRVLLFELSNHLAQPYRESMGERWDGVAIKQLVFV